MRFREAGVHDGHADALAFGAAGVQHTGVEAHRHAAVLAALHPALAGVAAQRRQQGPARRRGERRRARSVIATGSITVVEQRSAAGVALLRVHADHLAVPLRWTSEGETGQRVAGLRLRLHGGQRAQRGGSGVCARTTHPHGARQPRGVGWRELHQQEVRRQARRRVAPLDHAVRAVRAAHARRERRRVRHRRRVRAEAHDQPAPVLIAIRPVAAAGSAAAAARQQQPERPRHLQLL